MDSGDAGGTAHEDDLVDIVLADLRVGHRLTHRTEAPLNEVSGEVFELGPLHGHGEVLGSAGVGGDEGQADLGLGHRAELDLRLLGRLEQSLQRLRVVAQVDAVLVLELVGKVVHQPAVEVVAAQVGVTGGGSHFDDPVAHVEEADIERAATEVEHQDGLVVLLVHPVRQCGGGGLVDDAQHLEPGDASGVLGRGALGVVEVGGNGDDSLGHLLTEELAGVVDELAQHHGADLLRGIQLAADVEPCFAVGPFHDVEADGVGFLLDLVEGPADEPLGGRDGALRVEDALPAGKLPHQPFTVLGESDHRRGSAGSLHVRDDLLLAGLPDGDNGVRGPQIDSYCLGHDGCSFLVT